MTPNPFLLASLRFTSLKLFLVATCWLSISGCNYKNQPVDGEQACAKATAPVDAMMSADSGGPPATPPNAKRCPDNYYCASNNTCWRNGHSPDGGSDAAGKGGSGGRVSAGTAGVGGSGTGKGGASAVDGGSSKDSSDDVAPGSDGPLNCGTGLKLCGGACVPINDPAYGCDNISCDPSVCPAATPGLTLVCQGAACVIGACPADTKKCGTKCVSLTDPAYGCGATTCDASTCPAVSGSGPVVCQGTACVIGTCPANT